jgi:hypothetical protein
MRLRKWPETYHERDVIVRGDENHLSSVGVALLSGGVELLSDMGSWLTYHSYGRCFDIDPDNQGYTVSMRLKQIYGWFILAHHDWRKMSLFYLDNRLMLTFDEIADIIEAALNGKEKIFI